MNIPYIKVKQDAPIEIIIRSINDLIKSALKEPGFDISKSEFNVSLVNDDFVNDFYTIFIEQKETK